VSWLLAFRYHLNRGSRARSEHQEAATNAIYEAALLSWAKERDPASGEAMAAMMIGAVRKHRMDKWGCLSKPEDW
jgi:hypothetical protein